MKALFPVELFYKNEIFIESLEQRWYIYLAHHASSELEVYHKITHLLQQHEQ